MVIPLAAATVETCGGKAAGLGRLLRAGLPVPDGVVVPFDVDAGQQELRQWLVAAGNPVVAVRSSAADEDTAGRSAAGQYDSFLGVQGVDAVVDAVRACRESLWSARATAYRDGAAPGSMAVIVQRQVEADVSGVMFTGPPLLIEASWGLGSSVVEGRVTPDRYVVVDGRVTRTIADKRTYADRAGRHPVEEHRRRTPTLTDELVLRLAALGRRAAALFATPQDLEWSLQGTTPWLLQTRPITTDPPAAVTQAASDQCGEVLVGVGGSSGVARGVARVVRGPADFPRVRAGDILVCPHTDPSWTPLLTTAAGVVTETGGILSHAAIVARERGIPAVLSVPDATTRIPDGTTVTVDGSAGTVRP